MDPAKVRGHGVRIEPGPLTSRILNPIALHLRLLPILTVPGRRSGAPRSVPMGPPFEHAGTRYLVSPLGETHWVRNLRAAGRARLRMRGRIEDISVVEVTGERRDQIVAAFRLRLGPSSRANFDRAGGVTVHPVFEIVPVSADDSSCRNGYA